MKGLRQFLDRYEPLFSKGGKYERFYVVFEMIDGFFFNASTVSPTAPHVRDASDLKRVMTIVVIGVFPCTLMALYNTGLQANTAMAGLGIDSVPGWRGFLLEGLGIGYDPASLWACMWHGLLYFLPIYIATLVVGGFGKSCSPQCAIMKSTKGFSSPRFSLP